MKNLLIALGLFIIGLIVGFILSNSNSHAETIKTIEYKDTGSYHVKLIPKPYKVDSLIYIHDSVFIDIDTAQILADYFIQRGYSDTIINDSSLTISYSANVGMNKLQNITFDYTNNRPTLVTNNIVKTKPSIYIGVGVGGNSQSFDYGVTTAYQRDKMLYSGSYYFGSKSVYVTAALGF